ncbi:DUF2098 domain-containing protein [Methanoculleus sp. FWC-SCC1]|uniref:DUF2098 domain-containing protein n=1 Tax=Methanoculleus frigidifontis TaxID=2584085 RepID=A0ABT8MAT1_9EURY|nr:DUF2098 domain-containing protein [Methanoculleus sp. FWC-SCC1]MDN7025047.1 DUF2098 domain-containing protein [Methanoculleus sp. FWC-SCC1]
MNADEIAVGMPVRYPRTGTSGTVVAIEEVDGEVYAELDSTHLLYRLDQLVGLGQAAGTGQKEEKERDVESYLEKEKKFAENLKDAWFATDQSCEGGG